MPELQVQVIEKPLECCKKSLEFKVVKVPTWQAYNAELADCDDCKTHYEKKVNSKIVYKMNNDESYNCLNCGGDILGERVAHTILDGPFPLSGSGRVRYEIVPYCPKCEQKPNFHGTPIRKFDS